MHAWLARQLSLHDNGLHHVGHAAWVAPLLAARLLGYGEETAARAVNLSAPAFIAPDGFSRGHLANVKALRSEEHTSELQSLMRISYAVFCLKKKKKTISE